MVCWNMFEINSKSCFLSIVAWPMSHLAMLLKSNQSSKHHRNTTSAWPVAATTDTNHLSAATSATAVMVAQNINNSDPMFFVFLECWKTNFVRDVNWRSSELGYLLDISRTRPLDTWLYHFYLASPFTLFSSPRRNDQVTAQFQDIIVTDLMTQLRSQLLNMVAAMNKSWEAHKFMTSHTILGSYFARRQLWLRAMQRTGSQRWWEEIGMHFFHQLCLWNTSAALLLKYKPGLNTPLISRSLCFNFVMDVYHHDWQWERLRVFI